MPIYNGNKKIDSLYFDGKKIASAFFGNSQVYSASSGGLPSKYQEVEYLESTGTQYIDSGVIQKMKPKIETKISRTRLDDIDYFGNSNAENGCFIVNLADLSNIYYRYGSSLSVRMIRNMPINTWLNCIFDNNVIIDNYTVGTIVSYDFSTNEQSIKVFKGRNNAIFKLAYCKIYDNDVLLRDFVPCYRKADNKPGLYDLVNGVFYTNSGTGEFIVGGNI